MDKATLHQRLQAVEVFLQRIKDNIAFQRQTITKLEGGGHDVKAAMMFLRHLEAKHARHLADRDRLFKQVANRA